MQDDKARAVVIPSSYGASGSGPGPNDTVESENVNAPAANDPRPGAGRDDAHDTPEESA